MSPYRRFRAVRANWDENLKLYFKEPDRFEREIKEAVLKRKPEYFRWHVGGDIPDKEYFDIVIRIAEAGYGITEFEIFSKRHQILMQYEADDIPDNLHVAASVWPSIELDDEVPKRYLTAWLRDPKEPDDRIPKDAFVCPGKCDVCRHCWCALGPGDAVVFDRH